MRSVVVISAAVAAMLALAAAPARADRWHTIAPGETLSGIARQYDCTVDEMTIANQLDGPLIRAGERLVIPDCGTAHPIKVRIVGGQSLGRPWHGRLAHPSRLPDGRGYHIRRPWRSYGTSYLVGYVERTIAMVRRRFPKAHVLAVGDISAERGGRITDHHSHQSGRDIDIGLYFKKQPADYPHDFISATPGNLDCEETYTIVDAFARTHDEPGGVQMIFLDFHVQGMLYKWAKAHGVSEEHLDWLFQYPHGRGTFRGIVRHEPNHTDHFHVRFQCAPHASRCG